MFLVLVNLCSSQSVTMLGYGVSQLHGDNKGVCEAFNLLCLLTAGTAAPAAESASSSMAAKACPPRPPILLSTRCLLLPTGIQAGPLFREERPVLLDVLSFFCVSLSLACMEYFTVLSLAHVTLHCCCLSSGPTTLLAPDSPHILPLRDILLLLMTREISTRAAKVP